MKTTEENNRMIAEFMGLVESSIPNKYWTKKTEDGFGDGKLIDLEYHTSWDWLMPCVKNILDIVPNKKIRGNGMFYVNLVFVETSLKEVNIEKTYQAVCQFIEWYNQNT